MPCTVIKPGDMADRILDREKHPQWQGERMKMVYAFPDDEKLWERYTEILASDPENYARCHERATEFYREHRQEMDAGVEVAWEERYEEDQVAADRYLASKESGDKPTRSLRFTKLSPPGA